jgi:hypothetical protein
MYSHCKKQLKYLTLLTLFISAVELPAFDIKRLVLKHPFKTEFVFANNKHEADYYGHYYGGRESELRTSFLLGIVYEKPNKSCLLKPFIALSTGWYKSEMYSSSRSGGFSFSTNGLAEFNENEEIFNFNSIPLIPQVGLNIRPFFRRKHSSNLTLEFRAGYQFNWVQQLYSRTISILTKNYVPYAGYWSGSYEVTHKTQFRNFRESSFPGQYFRIGMNNAVKSKKWEYGVSYSWQGLLHRGLEFSVSRQFN